MSFEPMTASQVGAYVEKLRDTAERYPRAEYHFAIVQAEGDRLIGWCTLRIHDVANREANIGYALRRDVWGAGYTTEAAHELLRFGFDTLGLHRICARCVPENVASIRVIEKIGMQREGHRRQHRWIKGAWWDSLDHAILESEWTAQQTAS